MPSPLENMWQAISEKQYSKAKEIISSHPEVDLVNAIDAKNKVPLAVYLTVVISKDRPLDLIRFVLTHPKLNFNYMNNNKMESIVDAILFTALVEILEMVIEDPRILINGQKLSWKSACNHLESSTRAYEKNYTKDPASQLTKSYQHKVDNYKKMVPMLRDATILHAIKTDDADLFERLRKEGANPADFLSNNILPSTLLTNNNPKLDAWFDASLKKVTKQHAASPSNFFNSMQQAAEIRAKIVQSKVDLQKEQAAIYKKAADARVDRLDSFVRNVK